MISPRSNYTWSENYALDKNGARCSIPEMNDGDLQTFGRLGLKAARTVDSAIIRNRPAGVGHSREIPATLSCTKVEVFPQAVVYFRQKHSIDKIAIYATNLFNFEVYWRNDEGEWQRLISFRQNKRTPKNPIVLHEHARTDAILIQANSQKPIPPSKLIQATRQSVLQVEEAQIAEVEVYGKS